MRRHAAAASSSTAVEASPSPKKLHVWQITVALHLIKLCVGCDSVKDLEDWVREKLKDRRKRGLSREHMHRTRMMPKRADELRDGGSLCSVIRGAVLCRASRRA